MRRFNVKLISFSVVMAAFLTALPVQANPALPLPLPAPRMDSGILEFLPLPLMGIEPSIEETILDSELSATLNHIQTLRYLSRCA